MRCGFEENTYFEFEHLWVVAFVYIYSNPYENFEVISLLLLVKSFVIKSLFRPYKRVCLSIANAKSIIYISSTNLIFCRLAKFIFVTRFSANDDNVSLEKGIFFD